jgi:hypothetical protein
MANADKIFAAQIRRLVIEWTAQLPRVRRGPAPQ